MPLPLALSAGGFLLSFTLGVLSLGFAAAELHGYIAYFNYSYEYYDYYTERSPANVAAFAMLILGSLALMLVSAVGAIKTFQDSWRSGSIKFILLAINGFCLLCWLLFLVLMGAAEAIADQAEYEQTYIRLGDSLTGFGGVNGAPAGALVIPCVFGSIVCLLMLILQRNKTPATSAWESEMQDSPARRPSLQAPAPPPPAKERFAPTQQYYGGQQYIVEPLYASRPTDRRKRTPSDRQARTPSHRQARASSDRRERASSDRRERPSVGRRESEYSNRRERASVDRRESDSRRQKAEVRPSAPSSHTRNPLLG